MLNDEQVEALHQLRERLKELNLRIKESGIATADGFSLMQRQGRQIKLELSAKRVEDALIDFEETL
jgi:hypothetical protein